MIQHSVGHTLPTSTSKFVRNGRIDEAVMWRYLVENNILREDAAREISETLTEVARRSLVAFNDARRFTRPLANGVGTKEYGFDRIAPVGEAAHGMSILDLGDRDLAAFSRTVIPIPVTASQFRLDARDLAAGRSMPGPSIDTVNLEEHTRAVAEKMEDVIVNGSDVNLGANTLPGYTNFTCREQITFSDSAWSALTPGSMTAAVTDVLAARTALRDNGFTGPYALYLPSNFDGVIDEDYKAESDRTLRERLLAVDGVERIVVAPALPASEVLLVQMTRSVVELAVGQDLTTVTWDEFGGLAMDWAVLFVGAAALRCANARAPLSEGVLPALTTASGIAHIA